MTDPDFDAPDAFDSSLECMAHRAQPGVIGARQHTHVCRKYPQHEPPHECHACHATWSKKVAA